MLRGGEAEGELFFFDDLGDGVPDGGFEALLVGLALGGREARWGGEVGAAGAGGAGRRGGSGAGRRGEGRTWRERRVSSLALGGMARRVEAEELEGETRPGLV